eukprot:gnl/TRDRNA2_/TRDRNA2_157972_c1_seq4.p3 gnl/TRDRNA2_/TRDRNA2_157972_c1~~gnl/TRDRNA2_/TRDRNA2_157972_c1_seq4.p3  ORF type:complete len:130 (-),score=21.22 gnl/TRDRNA2_/TRDRNA2_157972_c1_seq4:278-667(-)
MFTSVAWARDRWKPEEMIPRSGDVFLAPFTMDMFPEQATGFWQQPMYGIDFSAAAPIALRCCTEQSLNAGMDPSKMLAEAAQVWHLDCTSASAAEASGLQPAKACSFEVASSLCSLVRAYRSLLHQVSH